MVKSKKQKNGFIATSLIYSFFLVFLALLLAILATYLTTSRILSAYNKNVKTKLNNMTYVPEVYALGNDCYVEVNANKDILTTCFKTYNLIENPVAGDDYKCFYKDNTSSYIYKTRNLGVSSNPYAITCEVRNKNIDERYLSSDSTNIYVVSKLEPSN